MNSSPSPQARLCLSLLLSSLVAAAGCRGIQGPESNDPTAPAASPAAGDIETVSQALQGIWTGVDIGATAAGSSSVTGTTGSVTGGGADIWTAADAFRFHYMTVTGDVTITARVATMATNGGTMNTIAKAGVMIRKNLTAGAQNAMMLVTPTASNGFRFQNRPTDNVNTARNFGGSAAGSGWVRLSRVGNVIRSYYSTNGTSWTELFPVAGSTTPLTLSGLPATVEVGLAVTSHNTANTLTATFDNITFNPPQNPPGPPAAPTGLAATPGNNQVALSWNASSGATSYTVQRSTTQGSGYTDLAPGLTATSYTDTMAANGTTYYYVVRAVNGSGTSAASTEVSATPAPPPPPPAPTNVQATGGNQQVSLTWTAVSGASSYNIKFNTDGGSSYGSAGTSSTPSFTHTGRSNGTTYYYVVSAVAGGVEGADSSQVNATPQAPPPPGAPGNLVATAGNAQVSLSWTAVSGATGYNIKFNTDGSANYSSAGTSSTPSFTHTGRSNGTTYYYVVSATNASGESGNSNQASATPSAPVWQSRDIGTVGLAGFYGESAGTHTVRGAGADMYGTADAFRFAYQTVSGDVTITARVTGLALNQGSSGTLNAWAKAALIIRENDTSGARNVAVLISPTASNRVRQQLRSTAGGSTTSTRSPTTSTTIPEWLRLERVGNTFRTYHSENGTSWTEVTPSASLTLTGPVLVGMGVTSHSTSQLANGTFTDVTVTVPAPPAAPTGITAAGQNNQVNLNWNAVAGASSYTVRMGTSASGPFNDVATGVTTTQRTVTGLTNGTPYWFVVAAVNPSGTSANSAAATATPTLLRPSVSGVSPANGSTGASPQQTFVSCDVTLPNVGGGVDISTASSSTVIITRASDGALVPATYNTSGGADVVVARPMSALQPNTTYNFAITDGLRDLTGAPFMPFNSSFTTGDDDPPPPVTIAFDKFEQTDTATRRQWTSLTIGPDNRLYAATITGHIHRFNINADGSLVKPPTIINTVRSSNGNVDRAVIGLAWDPAATSSNLILWITHGGAALQAAPNWSGKLSRLSGSSLGTYQDYVINFPRSAKDHMTNSITFHSTEPNVIYITQGSMNAMGAPDNAWSLRKEHLLAAAILRVNLAGITSPPLNVQTNEDDETSAPGANGRYNPFAAGAPVTIWATGVRNAYDLLWHSNGELYSATNGSAAGGNSPATPSPLPSACTRRIDQVPNGNYTGPTVPSITSNPVAEDDYLYRVVQGGYYGHPNPSRCEWVLNGGNPTSGTDNTQVTAYPVGVQPDRNWRGNVFNFGAHYSPNGMIEWRSNVYPQLVGRILIIRYSGGDDVLVLELDPVTKAVKTTGGTTVGITGFTGFTDPLDIIHNPTNGNVYVTEYTGQRIFLLKPRL